MRTQACRCNSLVVARQDVFRKWVEERSSIFSPSHRSHFPALGSGPGAAYALAFLSKLLSLAYHTKYRTKQTDGLNRPNHHFSEPDRFPA